MTFFFARHYINSMLYADDTQLYMVCNKPSDITSVVEDCLEDICIWMKSNLLVLNSDKTEVIHFSSRHNKVVEELNSMRVCESIITPTSSVRNLGVHFESSGNLSSHVNQICKSAYFALYRIGKFVRC